MINKLSKKVYENSVNKGFYDNGNATNMGERIALIHSELSEALEADRKNKYCSADITKIDSPFSDTIVFIEKYKAEVKGTFEEELADVMIRVLDMAAYKGINLEGHVLAKMRFNEMREYMHGKKY